MRPQGKTPEAYCTYFQEFFPDNEIREPCSTFLKNRDFEIDSNNFPKIRHKNEKSTSFMIKDGTGAIDVDHNSANYLLKKVKMNRVGGPFTPDEEMKSILNRCNIKKTINNSIRAEEHILLPDTPVFAFGTLKLNQDGTRMLSKGKGKLQITDKSEFELTRNNLLLSVLGLLGAVLFIAMLFGMKKPEQHSKPAPPVQSIENYNYSE